MSHDQDKIRDVFSHIQPTEKLKHDTIRLMRQELNQSHKKRTHLFNKVTTYRSLLAVACALLLFISASFYRDILPSPKEQPTGPQFKININTKGIVTAVDSAHSIYQIGNQWMIVTDDTVFQTPEGNPLPREIEINHYIEATTEEDTTHTNQVIALQIYVNELR